MTKQTMGQMIGQATGQAKRVATETERVARDVLYTSVGLAAMGAQRLLASSLVPERVTALIRSKAGRLFA